LIDKIACPRNAHVQDVGGREGRGLIICSYGESDRTKWTAFIFVY